MSENLLHTLRLYEEEYPAQPLVAQRADLQVINRIRSQLGMPLVDARLKQIGVPVEEVKPEPKPKAVRDHTEAREIYRQYLKKVEELQPHLGRREGDAVEREVAQLLHRAVLHRHVADDPLLDVGLPDAHRGGAVGWRRDQALLDRERTDRGR